MQLWNQLEFMRLKHLKNSNFKTIYFKILVILAPWIENMADESMVVQVWSLDFHVQRLNVKYNSLFILTLV
jgi:hypothetical protein